MAQDPYKYFRLEARDLQDQFSRAILELEKSGGDASLVQRLLRLAHTLKGAARVVKQQEIADRAHAIEEELSPFRETAGHVDAAKINAVLAHFDEVNRRILALTPPEIADGRGVSKPAAEEIFRTVRADIAEMDSVLDGVSETHALLNGLRATTQDMESAQHLIDLLTAQLGFSGGANPGRPIRGNSDQMSSMAEELRKKLFRAERNLSSSIDQMDRELRQLREAAEQLRLVSAGTLFSVLERTARDTAHALSKQVDFVSSGSHIRLDSHVVEAIQAALVQIIRNAVAHGIEAVGERRSAGKADIGHVTVDVTRRGRNIAFCCRDDGHGLNLDAIRRVAQGKGLLAGAATQLGSEDLVRLLLRGGITTAATVTAASGRGIGLDVVREAVDRLGGEVIVHTEPGKGTSFEIVVPPSLTSMEALLVEAAGRMTAVPLDSVHSAIRLAAAEISLNSTNATVLYGGRAISFLPLATALGEKRPNIDRSWTAIVVTGNAEMAVVGVDRILGTARVVVRPLPEYLPASGIVAGAMLDAEGNPQLVLDPDGLVVEIWKADSSRPDTNQIRYPVLVIDDSLTTRMLEQSILESAGYEVDVALSAEEALEIARRKRYALFLVDVEMPGMDGYAFIERIRADPALHEIPAIMVTSRAEPEDRQRGIDAGAQGYVVKSAFDQTELLAMIRPLLD